MKINTILKIENSIIEEDYILLGHSHYDFLFMHNNTVVLNAGSVGQNRENGGIATWALLNTENLSIRQKFCKYDPSNIIKETKSIDKNLPFLWNLLLR